MRFKIQAGGTIDVATREEVRQEIEAASASWFAEVARGDRFVRFAVEGDPAGGGNTLIGEYAHDRIGPREGFVWSLKRLSVTGYDPAADSLRLYAGSESDSATIIPKLDMFHAFADNAVVMYPGERLLIAGTVTGGSRIWVTGQARELPLALAWRL